jgi:hypothetical protein
MTINIQEKSEIRRDVQSEYKYRRVLRIAKLVAEHMATEYAAAPDGANQRRYLARYALVGKQARYYVAHKSVLHLCGLGFAFACAPCNHYKTGVASEFTITTSDKR